MRGWWQQTLPLPTNENRDHDKERRAVSTVRRWATWMGSRSVIGALMPDGSGFESSRYLAKWLLLGSAIGVVAGLGAVVFARAIHFATQLFLGDIVGYLPPLPVGEGSPVEHAIAR